MDSAFLFVHNTALISSSNCSIIVVGGDIMIKTTSMLHEELCDHANPKNKIRQMVKNGELFPIRKGLYKTTRDVPGYCLAEWIYGPSYLSFEFALAWHGLIPDAVNQFTLATVWKKRRKDFETPMGYFSYKKVPDEAYPYGIELREENDYSFHLATPEKALCDQLFIMRPCRSQKQLNALLYEELRLDRDLLQKINTEKLLWIASFYHRKNHQLLKAYIMKEMCNGRCNMKKPFYPENLILDIGTELICGTEQYTPLSPAQLSELEEAIDSLSCEDKQLIIMRYKDQMKYRFITDALGGSITRRRVEKKLRTTLRKLRLIYRTKSENITT